MIIRYSMILLLMFITGGVYGQNKAYTEADTLRGSLNKWRTAYDVQFYDLDIAVDIENKSLKGSNTIVFNAEHDFDKMQIDLFSNMQIDAIKRGDKELTYERKFNAVFVNMGETVKKDSKDSIKVFYHGKPIEAERAPWDGGFVWAKDTVGNPWISVASQGEGASLWWPNKDHLSDEPDHGVQVSITVPDSLKAVSGGRMIGRDSLENGHIKYIWRTHAPINNYNVSLYVGDYVHYKEFYTQPEILTGNMVTNRNKRKTLDLDYYVLRYNVDKAKEHFKSVENVIQMFEALFGPYPFYEDGYAVVEAPYLGMEHQGAIAYGNNYKYGWDGDQVKSYIEFDYLLVHETAHEWWGNNVSVDDIAALWIHEAFATYADAVYVYRSYGFEGYGKYIDYYRSLVKNDKPILNPRGLNDADISLDAYYKGALMLNTLSQLVEDNDKWFGAMKKAQKEFAAPRTVSHEEFIAFLEKELKMDLKPFFKQYLETTKIPTLELRFAVDGKTDYMVYRWTNVVENFDMPVKVKVSKYNDKWIYPTEKWKKAKIPRGSSREDIDVELRAFYIDVKRISN